MSARPGRRRDINVRPPNTRIVAMITLYFDSLDPQEEQLFGEFSSHEEARAAVLEAADRDDLTADQANRVRSLLLQID